MGLIYLITMAENFSGSHGISDEQGALLLLVFKVTSPSFPCPSSEPMARQRSEAMKINRQLSD